MEQFNEILKWTGLDPALFGVAFSLALALYLAQAYIHWVDTRVTFAIAFVMAGVGAFSKWEQHATWQAVLVNSIGLLSAQLLGQFLLEKVPFLPKNNQFVKPPAPPAA